MDRNSKKKNWREEIHRVDICHRGDWVELFKEVRQGFLEKMIFSFSCSGSLLSCGVLTVVHGLLVAAWDPLSLTRIKPRPTALGAWSFNHKAPGKSRGV